MGADEITCEEVSHELDWSGNGIINMEEFAVFSAAWLSHDPNDPAFDPEDPSYNPHLSDPNYPDEYITDGQKLAWNPDCDLDDNYAVDVNDFIVFAEDWLWEACYKASQEGTLMMLESLGGYDGLIDKMAMTAELSLDSFQTAQLTKARELKVEIAAEKAAVSATSVSASPIVEEKSIKEQILDLESAIKFLEEIWMEDDQIQKEIDPDAWQKFIDSVYQSLLDLQSQEQAEQ
jgi:hypothetical protein